MCHWRLTVENSQAVIEAGADLCAVISDILALSVENIPARVAAWAQLFAETANLNCIVIFYIILKF